MPVFGVSQFTTMPQTFEQDLDLYQSLGLGGIEVCTQKLAAEPPKAREQLNAVAQRGLTVTSVQPAVHSLFPDRLAPEPADPEQRMQHYRRTIDLVVDTLPAFRGPLVAIGGAAPAGNLRAAWQTAERAFADLADYAGERNLSLAFEPIHPLLMNQDTFIWTLDEAAQLAEKVNRPNFGVIFDVWHTSREPNLADHLARIGPKLFLVHHSDWPAGGPRRFDDRTIPGEGVIDLPAIFRTLDRINYRGDHVLEALSNEQLPDSLWKQDPDEVIQRSRAGLREAGCPAT